MEEAAGSQKTSKAFTDPVAIGRIVGAHGVRGTLRVKALGSGRHLRKDIEPLVGGERRRILTVRETPKGFLVDLEDVAGREEAARLRGMEMFLDREDLDPPEEEEFYVGDLVGLPVYDGEGAHLGSVADVLETPAHEILVVRDGSDEERYVPFTLEHVPTIDLQKGCIMVNLPVPE